MNVNAQLWFAVTSPESIPVREGRAVELEGRQIALFNLGDQFRAVENRCPHRGGPLSDGILSGSKIVCPLHAWTFDLADGGVTNHPESQACLTIFPVRIEDGMVWVGVPGKDPETKLASSASDHRDRPIRWVQRKVPPSTADISGGANASTE
jgi:nitrite reductase (NADH) small subunit